MSAKGRAAALRTLTRTQLFTLSRITHFCRGFYPMALAECFTSTEVREALLRTLPDFPQGDLLDAVSALHEALGDDEAEVRRVKEKEIEAAYKYVKEKDTGYFQEQDR